MCMNLLDVDIYQAEYWKKSTFKNGDTVTMVT
jgi:hypothetical protein